MINLMDDFNRYLRAFQNTKARQYSRAECREQASKDGLPGAKPVRN